MRLFRCALLATLFVSTASAYVVYTDSGIYVISWYPGTIPMQIKLPTSPTLADGTSYATSVKAAMDSWNAVLGVVQFTYTGQNINTPLNPPSGTYTNGNGINEIVMDSTIAGMAFGSGVLAITETYTSGDTLVEADLIFNTTHTWDSYRGNLRASEDIRRVAIHELGHVLGLDHPDQAKPPQMVTAIMNSIVSDIDTMQADDISGVQLLYGVPGVVPGNDSFAKATAITLSGNSIQLTGTNVAATKETGEPVIAGANAPGHSVWWKWTAPSSASTTITTLGSNFDTVLGIYTGSSVSTLTVVASNDDVQSGVIRTSTVTFNAVSGTTYYIAVDGWGSTSEQDLFTYSGAITLNLSFSGSVSSTAPAITLQPLSQTVNAGYSVTFTAAASGTPAPTFQWQKNTLNINGANGSSFTIASVATSDAGSYTVVATNSVGSATSNAATFTVNLATNTANSAYNDFNGDGKPDLLWQNSLTGERALWLMNGTQFIASSTLGIFPPEWTVAATGDFNGDGKPDIIWSNSLTGERAIWLMNGTNFLGASTLGIFPLEWTVAATGDFNGDGKPDIIWSNSLTGERAIWLMNGTNFLASSTLGIFPLEWTVAATGDFNGDGKPDIIWSNSLTGERAIWLMNGTNFLASSTLGIFPREWTVVATGDYNGDGKTDIIWSNSLTGERAIWLMNGTNFLASSTLGIFPLEWTVLN